MTEEKRPTKAEIQRWLHGDPVYESNNPNGIIAARNRFVKPAQADNATTEQPKE